jgi:3-isopropylmalate/(R)-2-methylmalate dehydratase large subunit
MPKTLFDKIWDAHVVGSEGGTTILYIDRHLLHDLKGGMLARMKAKGLKARRPQQTFAVIDHSIPTLNQQGPYADPETAALVRVLREEQATQGYTLFDVGDPRNGITHVVGPEQGITLPGITLCCGDSHTATHGALGCLAFGIGTTEAEHVMATQTVLQKKPSTLRVTFGGTLPRGVYSKDLILALIGQIGIGGGTGHAIEYAGEAIRALSMEARMTLCNMTIEGGARTGMVAPDETTFAYVKGRPFAPSDAQWDAALVHWKALPSDAEARFDREVSLDAGTLAPQVTWGTNPGMVTGVDGRVPDPRSAPDADQRAAWERALEYMGLAAGTPIADVKVDRVFIGSCTNSRIEDLRIAAKLVQGKRVASGVQAMVVPGSGLVRLQAQAEGLDRIFSEAGFSWREPGCSMCIAMNGDMLAPGERAASTTNRNFEGRQGRGGRTHLVSPAMAAAAAVAGHFVDVRELGA